MSDKYLLDTNIIVYSFDASNRQKQGIARSLIERALAGAGIVCSQVVQEFVNVATRKFTVPLSTEDCRDYLDAVLTPLCEVFTSIELYRSALGIKAETGFTFYDALVVAAAVQSECTYLYSEDLQHGQRVRELTIHNPFL